MSLRSRLRKLFGRGDDPRTALSLVEILAQWGVTARPTEGLPLGLQPAPGMRLRAVVEIDERPLRHLALTQVSGRTAGHGGEMRVIGVHLLIDRSALGDEWPSEWTVPVRAAPLDPPGGIGASRDFEWRPADATDASARTAVELLSASERIHQRVLRLLRDGAMLQFEVSPSEAPGAERVRVAVHQPGRELPDPSAVEALITVARAMTGAE